MAVEVLYVRTSAFGVLEVLTAERKSLLFLLSEKPVEGLIRIWAPAHSKE